MEEFSYWRIFLAGKASITELDCMDYTTIMKINALLDYQADIETGMNQMQYEAQERSK